MFESFLYRVGLVLENKLGTILLRVGSWPSLFSLGFVGESVCTSSVRVAVSVVARGIDVKRDEVLVLVGHCRVEEAERVLGSPGFVWSLCLVPCLRSGQGGF